MLRTLVKFGVTHVGFAGNGLNDKRAAEYVSRNLNTTSEDKFTHSLSMYISLSF